ncbi:MAG TPA: hypothetical protein VLK33_00580 [Terriglobales bacterium]|nr:hypothetical protein [Terriglobales bacterium]
MSEKETEIKIPVKQRSASFCPALKYKLLSDEEVNFTKAKAFDFLELKTFEGERPVRDRHVQFLFDEWSGGRFLWQNIILASANCKGSQYRINGQHTCWMRVNIPERYEPLNCKVRIMVYAVDTPDRLKTLYSVFDRGAPRTAGHLSKVLLMDTAAADGFPNLLINQMIAGFRIFFSPDLSKRKWMPINEWCGLIQNNYTTLFSITGQFLALHKQEAIWIRRAAVIAGLLATFEKNVEKSEEFWTPVFSGIGLDSKTDARYQLRRYMETHGHDVAATSLTKVSPDAMFGVCINLWNHWRRGTPVTSVRPVDVRPKVLA